MKELSHVELMKKHIAEVFDVPETRIVYKGQNNYIAVLENGKEITFYKPTVRILKAIKAILSMKQEAAEACIDIDEDNFRDIDESNVRNYYEGVLAVVNKMEEALGGSYEIQ